MTGPIVSFALNNFRPEDLPYFRYMDLSRNFQLITVFAAGNRCLPEHNLVEFTGNLESSRNFDEFPAFAGREKTSYGLDMIERNVAEL